jgi:hypothetical protein
VRFKSSDVGPVADALMAAASEIGFRKVDTA